MQVQTLGWEDPLKKEMVTQFSILAWKVPWTEVLRGLQYIESDTTELLGTEEQEVSKKKNQIS